MKNILGKLKGKWKYLAVFISVIMLIALLTPSYISAGNSSQLEAFVSRFYQLCLDWQPD